MIQRNRNFVFVCAALCAPLFLGFFDPAAIAAPQATTSPVSIRVTDASGASISHAAIRVVPSHDPAPAKMETDEAGQLSLNLSTGSYALFVEARGFKAAATHIDVQGTKEVQIVPVRLEIEAMMLGPVVSELIAPTDELRVSAYTKQGNLK